MHAYNCTRSEATGFSPYYLLFGQSPRLPIDLLFNLQPSEKQENHSEYVKQWQARMREAYEIAANTDSKESMRREHYYHKKSHGVELQPGNRVLLRNLGQRGGPGKLKSHWEDKVYVVMSRKSKDSPVYEIAPGRGGKSHVVHRNLLLPCDSLPVEDPEPEADYKNASNVRTRQQRQADLNSESEDTEGEDEHEMVLRFPHRTQQSRTTSSLNPNAEPYQPRREEEDNEQVIEVHLPADVEERAVSEEEAECQEPPEQVAEVEEEHAEGGPQEGHRHPQRQRHPPQMLTYDALGQPRVTTRGMDVKQMDVKKPPPCVQMLWRPMGTA